MNDKLTAKTVKFKICTYMVCHMDQNLTNLILVNLWLFLTFPLQCFPLYSRTVFTKMEIIQFLSSSLEMMVVVVCVIVKLIMWLSVDL